jgi:tRNA (guanine-N7-)-methyltransferase
MNDHVSPARSHHRVLTYARRGSRFTNRQQHAWDAYAERFWIPDEQVDQPGFSFAGCFDSDQPLVVEIGSGIGEATAALAAQRPAYNVLGFEVWRPGVAESLGRVGELGLTNVRMCSVDAVWSVEHLLAEGQLAELWTFFPDPWHKKRHHKRRLVSPDFARLAASRLAPGAVWRFATDWADYAAWAQEVLDAEPLLEGGPVPRWEDRPGTRFERRGVAEGREIVDLAYRRV